MYMFVNSYDRVGYKVVMTTASGRSLLIDQVIYVPLQREGLQRLIQEGSFKHRAERDLCLSDNWAFNV